jgi:HSP20 family protein
MALVRFRPFGTAVDPFRDMSDIQSEVNRLFDNFFGRPSQSQGSGMERVWAPAVDMYETRDELVVTAEVPGLNEKDIHLSITGDMLTIKGERNWNEEVKQEQFYRSERWFGRFERSLPLTVPVQADKVKASYRDGVLTVKLPKAEEIKPKEIKIDLA